ncbi:hypothetical protein [Hydrotalea sp.]|uniref:hypothetical protein n=1 Tax=Hydrotalea sp. TaxID=2881279 RepID=UPI00262B3B6E|nr:hypothetical protein [Hydrotalea sp.]
MENNHSNKLDNLHQQSVETFNAMVKEKEQHLSKEQQDALQHAHQEWQVAWNKLLNALMVIDKLEI